MADIAGDTSTIASLTVGGTASGTLEVLGDHDWYRINLSAGQAISVTLSGISFEDTYLYIRDSAGNILFSNDDISDGNLSSQVAFSATYTGTYYIDVGAWNEAATGTYQVSVQPYTPPPLATNDQIADELVSGYWGGDSHHFNVTQGGSISVNISTLNASEQALARAALAEWTDIIGVTFREVTVGGQIKFDHSEDASGNPVASTSASWSNGITSSANVHISSSWVNRYGTSLYSYSFQTYIHEIGHALGLGHAGDYNGTARYPYDALFQNDAWSTSIMSYFDQGDNTYFAGQGFTENYAVTPMVADILAMQRLYGLSTTTRSGNTTYGFNSNAGGVYDASAYPRAAYTIFDSAGTDTLDFSGASATQIINLNPETFSNVNGRVGNLMIARGVVIENATGGSGVDTIIGNGANNVLKGGGGADILTGGAGNDAFVDTVSGHNGDRITDFSAGDTLIFSNATLGSFSFSLSGTTLNYSGGSLTFNNVPQGNFVASVAPSGGVQLALAASLTPLSVAPIAASGDFNGDGRDDILWRNDSGRVTDWLGQLNSGFVSNFVNADANAGLDWHVVGIGDFNGDHRSDVLWRNDNGAITNWLGQAGGGFASNFANAYYQVDKGWHVAATGDFNGDGRDDILWRDNSGRVTDWLGQANSGFASNFANADANAGTDWQIVGTGDFNGDGRDDILWRNSNGDVTNWLGQINGGFVSNFANAYYQVDNSWHVVGTGDFNGDGRADILWRNDSGRVTDWLGQTNTGFISNFANADANAGTDWHVVSTGDFNGDGRDDILWRNDNGDITNWLGQTNGGFVSNFGNAYYQIDNSWHTQPQDLL